jgi:hypothetical protein
MDATTTSSSDGAGRGDRDGAQDAGVLIAEPVPGRIAALGAALAATLISEPSMETGMRKVSLAGALMIATTTHVGRAQNIPATVREAEAQGADFAHDAPQVVQQPYFSDFPFGGTAERRCVAAAGYVAYTSSMPNGSLRSGDFIVRGEFSKASWGGFQAVKEHKVLWLPLHGSSLHKAPLVVRAARIGNAADSVRLRIQGLTHGTSGESEPLYGYPSEVSFPSAGQWVIVATAGNDWGCFVLDVAPRANGN